LWPALALIGFFVLVALVVALGTESTDRYEREQRARGRSPRLPRRPSAAPGSPDPEGEHSSAPPVLQGRADVPVDQRTVEADKPRPLGRRATPRADGSWRAPVRAFPALP